MSKTLAALLAVALLNGCAAINTVQSDISTFGEWPAGRSPGAYVFDRLPSQQAAPDAAERLEVAARGALAKAGFRAAAAGESADVLVQLAARSTPSDAETWADPFWWHGGFGMGRRSWIGPTWWGDVRFVGSRYDREVAVLLRDRASGKPLYEARATNLGSSTSYDRLNAALFEAALFDFPRTGPNPRTVTVSLP